MMNLLAFFSEECFQVVVELKKKMLVGRSEIEAILGARQGDAKLFQF